MAKKWLINDLPGLSPSAPDTWIEFTSNGNTYNRIRAFSVSSVNRLCYGDTVVFYSSTGWADEGYKIIEFAIEPTGTLLIWLRANANPLTSINLATLMFDVGYHSVTVKAMADNYTDSIASNAIIYNERDRLAAPTLAFEGEDTISLLDNDGRTSTYKIYADDTLKTTIDKGNGFSISHYNGGAFYTDLSWIHDTNTTAYIKFNNTNVSSTNYDWKATSSSYNGYLLDNQNVTVTATELNNIKTISVYVQAGTLALVRGVSYYDPAATILSVSAGQTLTYTLTEDIDDLSIVVDYYD